MWSFQETELTGEAGRRLEPVVGLFEQPGEAYACKVRARWADDLHADGQALGERPMGATVDGR